MKKPLPPKTVLRLVKLWPYACRQGHKKGEIHRIGYYCKHCGLDVVWLVNNKGEYNWTADQKWVKDHFEIIEESKERSLYGVNRPKLGKFKGHSI
jgi:hypothetical protein